MAQNNKINEIITHFRNIYNDNVIVFSNDYDRIYIIKIKGKFTKNDYSNVLNYIQKEKHCLSPGIIDGLDSMCISLNSKYIYNPYNNEFFIGL